MVYYSHTLLDIYMVPIFFQVFYHTAATVPQPPMYNLKIPPPMYLFRITPTLKG